MGRGEGIEEEGTRGMRGKDHVCVCVCVCVVGATCMVCDMWLICSVLMQVTARVESFLGFSRDNKVTARPRQKLPRNICTHSSRFEV